MVFSEQQKGSSSTTAKISTKISSPAKNKLNSIPLGEKFELYKIYQVEIKTLLKLKQKTDPKEGVSFVDLSPLLFILSVNKERITAINLRRLSSPLDILLHKKYQEIKQRLVTLAKDEKKLSPKIKEMTVFGLVRALTQIQKTEVDFIVKAESKIRTYLLENVVAFKKIETPKDFEKF